MEKKNILKAVKRDVKANLNTLRQKGMVPAVLYGHGFTPVTVAVEAKPFDKLMETEGGSGLITLDIEGKSENALVKSVQKDIIRRNPIHIDFQRVVMTEKIEVNVQIHIVGEAPGVKVTGGLLEHLTRSVKVRCLPSNIPHAINVDVSSMNIGESVLVKDLKPMEGVEVLTDPGLIVVHVVVPHVEEEAPAPGAAAAPGAAEPEVIAKGKKDEEGAVAEGGKAPAAGDKKAAAPAAGAKPDAKAAEAKKPDAKK